MSPTRSLSRTSTSTTSISKLSPSHPPTDLDLELSSHPQPTTTTPSLSSPPKQCTTHLTNHYTPTTHPQTRNSYLTLRILCITLALFQIALVAIAASGALSSTSTRPLPSKENPNADPKKKLRHWLDPSLSPAISSLFWCAVDVAGVVKWKRRAHHLARGVYDGVLAGGFGIGAGFFIGMAGGVLNRTVEGTTGAEMGVGGGLVCCMFGMVILHSLISFGGIRDTIETRRAIRLARGAGQS